MWRWLYTGWITSLQKLVLGWFSENLKGCHYQNCKRRVWQIMHSVKFVFCLSRALLYDYFLFGLSFPGPLPETQGCLLWESALSSMIMLTPYQFLQFDSLPFLTRIGFGGWLLQSCLLVTPVYIVRYDWVALDCRLALTGASQLGTVLWKLCVPFLGFFPRLQNYRGCFRHP